MEANERGYSRSGPYQNTNRQKRTFTRVICALFVLAITSILLFSLHIYYSNSSSPWAWAGKLPQYNLFNMTPASTRLSSSESSPYTLLSSAALEEILARGAPILGDVKDCEKSSATSDWMATISDDTRLVHMNLPGTHDSATWNYTSQRQAELERYTGKLPPSQAFRCQHRSIFQMLNDGIRVFDLRYAYNPGNDTIGFYHSAALLAPTTSLTDVLFGYYYWLSKHPTETVLLSFNHENGTGTVEDARLQGMIFDTFRKASLSTTSSPAGEDGLKVGLGDRLKERFWMQSRGELGTLGSSRGKLILLQRFSYSKLPQPPLDNSQLIGLDFGADRWTDNGDNIRMVYNPRARGGDEGVAFIEDRYAITLPPTIVPSVEAYIQAKYEATVAHLERAIARNELESGISGVDDSLFWTFTSAAALQDSRDPRIVMFPETYALGTPGVPGMNQRLLSWFKQQNQKSGSKPRFGIVMMDFYDSSTPGLVQTILGL